MIQIGLRVQGRALCLGNKSKWFQLFPSVTSTSSLYRYSSSASSTPARSGEPSSTGTKRKPVTVNVELPDVLKDKNFGRNSFVLFCLLMGVSFYGIVKYEAASAPVVSSTLYTLRRSEKGRAILGNNISFGSLMPWISGTVAAASGIVDFSYSVKGDNGFATAHFNSRRDPVTKRFVVLDWSLTTPDGTVVSLMDEDFHPFVPGPKEEPTRRIAGI
ncbi:Coa1p [Sugiyamaella lignohabitans]|uniref:Coa1p n=1 Tax=Sugiyamaella lignohabitans TaxID=796027 RepID=A0A167FVQ6_9ASCO|nr:Coa1p [Sugiyamaella lignohabitans]ANB15758.1 Coa1p [Sugiyamaella lignohabitans]